MIVAESRALRTWESRNGELFAAALTMARKQATNLNSSPPGSFLCREVTMRESWQRLLRDESGQDIAEYAVMLAVILAIVVGTIRLIGSSANNVFSSVASSIQ
jgi:Flp pilus assembly pilin Flp